ncbi:MAG: molybdopterin-dependent oxidoreductase [Eggerthellaceae bacterium]|nr:molybdopterin-dependent oxidoreductase [Eggerthellaceae bacterium]
MKEETRATVQEGAKRGLTRRSFLKATAATAGAAAIAGVALEAAPAIAEGESAKEEIYQGLCRGNCGGGCRIKVTVREGKVVKTGPTVDEDPMENLICARGYTHTQRIYAPERIQFPMRRVEGTPRGGGEFERISWDEAISYICDHWKQYQKEFGDSSIAYSYGAGTYAQNYYVYMRLFNSLGATKIAQENDMTMLNYSWKMLGMSLYMVGNSRKDQVNAHTTFIWGCNASIGTFNRWKYLMASRDRGGRLIVIDPTFTVAAQKADLWVPIKPGTDAALAMAMVRYWHENGKDDQAYLASMTVAPFLVRQDTLTFLRSDEAGIEAEREAGAVTGGGFGLGTSEGEGSYPIVAIGPDGQPGLLRDIAAPAVEGTFEVNGIPCKTAYTMLLERCDEWDISAASAKTEIPEDTIVQLAELYLEGPTMLHTGFGIDHRGNGDGASHALCVLPLVSGQIGQPGMGITGNLAGATTGFAGDNWMTVVTSKMKPGATTNMSYIPQIMEEQQWCGQPMHLKSIFFYAGNPLGSYSGTTALREAFEEVELLITADTVWSDTAKYSDVVLPVPHWFEYETYRTCPNDYLDFNDECIPPQFESKPDTEIISLLGLGMDLGPEFEFTNAEIHAMFLDTDVARDQYGVTWETLKQQKHMKMAPDEFYYGNQFIPFATETGRAEFFFENPVPEFDKSRELDRELYALPFQSDQLEDYDTNPLREKYPLNLMTHRDKFKVHTAFAKCPWLLEIQPEPTIEMNPIDAEKYGLAENDYVKCYNDRGFVVLKLHLDPSMRPGTAWTEHTWLDDQYKAGHYADVTSLACTHFFPTNTPFDTLVAVEKYEEEV